VMEQFAGGLTADQLSVVPELVVEEEVRPVGAPGLAAQEPPPPPLPVQGPESVHSAGTFGGCQPSTV
jgi:hypothetical protein